MAGSRQHKKTCAVNPVYRQVTTQAMFYKLKNQRSILPHRAFPFAASVVVMYRLQEEASMAAVIVSSTKVFIFICAMGGFPS